MKKCTALLVTVALLAALAACGAPAASSVPTAAPSTRPLSEIMADLNEGLDAGPMLEQELTAEFYPGTLFIDYAEGFEAFSSEPMISASAHSVVLLRVPVDADSEAVAASIRENADPGKWICVQAEKTIVEVRGDVILLVMSSGENADLVAANFEDCAL